MSTVQIHPNWLRTTPVIVRSTELGPRDSEPESQRSPDADLTLRELLVALRQRRGWTQDELTAVVCDITGCDTFGISSYETGRREPSLRSLIILADALALNRGDRIALIEASGYRINVEEAAA